MSACYKWSVAVLSAIILVFLTANASADSAFLSQVPAVQDNTISINGDSSDWDMIPAAILDPQGDNQYGLSTACASDTDIKSLYFAKDSSYLYWRIDTYNGFSTTSPLILLFYESNASNGGYNNGIDVNLSNHSAGRVSTRTDNQNMILRYEGSEYGYIGQIAEGKIPLTEFATFNIQPVIAYYWRDANAPNFDQQCDAAQRFYYSPTISITGKVVDSQGNPISDARIEQAENSGIFTISAGDGSFNLNGVTSGSPFSLRISKNGYVTDYSETRPANNNFTFPYPHRLLTPQEMAPWGNATDKSAIWGIVEYKQIKTPIAGAVIACTSAMHPGACPYQVIYSSDGITYGGTSTYQNGLYVIKDVDPGDTLTVTASKPGDIFNSRTFIAHGDGISYASIGANLPSGSLTLTVTTIGQGTVSVNAPNSPLTWNGNIGTGSYTTNTLLTLTAAPFEGFIFSGWSGDVCIGTGACTVTMAGAKSVRAIFTDAAFAATSSAIFKSQIPTVDNGVISINGYPDDWNNIQPVVTDLTNDSICGPGTDIKNFYLAKDSNYLYWRVDTADGNFTFGTQTDPRLLVLLFYESNSNKGITVNIGNPDSGYVSARYDNNANWTGLYGGPQYGTVGSVAEGKIPLSEFAPYNIGYINAYYWKAPDAIQQCDEAVRSFNPVPTISVSGKVVDSQGNPISDSRIEQAGNPNIFAISAANGTYTLNGLPSGEDFSLRIIKYGYVTTYTDNRNSTANISTGTQYKLINDLELMGWHIDPGKSAIWGVVQDNGTPKQPFSDAAITCISTLHQNVCPYTIEYYDGTNYGGISTYQTGIYVIRNVDPGDIVTVSASKPEIDFNIKTFIIHGDGISFGNLTQRSSAPNHTLTIYKTGTGIGSIYNDVGYIDWNGNSGTGSYNSGAVITLTAEADAGSIFSSWTGNCDITNGNKCIIMKTSAKAVSATFTDVTAPSITPSVLPGKISSPQLITFGSNEPGTIYYTLDGSDPTTSPTRIKYSGEAIYISTTTTIRYFAADNNGNVGPIIPLPYIMTYALSVNISGSQSGTVKDTDETINCGTDCTANYAEGKTVTLTALPEDNNSMFVGWSGKCTGSEDCILTMNENKNVIAEFTKNLPPVLSTIGDKSLYEGELLQFTVSAKDPEGNTLNYSAGDLPAGATFDPITRTFNWTPNYDQAGVYSNVEFSVTDNGMPIGVASQLITITVGNVNRPPVFEPIGSIQAQVGQLIEFTLTATDPDGDSAISYYAEPLPEGASFDPVTRTFSWTPDYNQAGTYTRIFYASDNGSPESKTGSTAVVISVSVPPPDVLITQIVNATYSLQLSKETENSYVANLKKVGIFIKDGKLIPALNQLNATLQKIKTDIKTGNINETKGNKLIVMINCLIDGLNS